MSTCISRHGEFSSHDMSTTPYICPRCLIVDLEALARDLHEVKTVVAKLRAERFTLVHSADLRASLAAWAPTEVSVFRPEDTAETERWEAQKMAHHTGIDPDGESVIRRALSWHFPTDAGEREAARGVLDALAEAGYVVMKAEYIDGATDPTKENGS